jgi:hypothetical protein
MINHGRCAAYANKGCRKVRSMEEKMKRANRLRDLLANVRAESEEIMFLLGHTPDASPELIAAFDRIIRLLNEE